MVRGRSGNILSYLIALKLVEGGKEPHLKLIRQQCYPLMGVRKRAVIKPACFTVTFPTPELFLLLWRFNDPFNLKYY